MGLKKKVNMNIFKPSHTAFFIGADILICHDCIDAVVNPVLHLMTK